jgi:hypothetical protein
MRKTSSCVAGFGVLLLYINSRRVSNTYIEKYAFVNMASKQNMRYKNSGFNISNLRRDS